MQVVELELAKEYALRVKEVAAQEAQAAAAAAHSEALQAQQQLMEGLQQEMRANLVAHDKQLHQADERHQVRANAALPWSANKLGLLKGSKVPAFWACCLIYAASFPNTGSKSFEITRNFSSVLSQS